jgi:hypothetical protein
MLGNKFYVYEHWRPDKGVCFYVGKGTGPRAWSLKFNRNRHHLAVISKLTALGLAVDIRIIARDLTSADALVLEVERIAFYGRETLTNQTDGGDGQNGASDETREKLRRSHKRRLELDPHALDYLFAVPRRPITEAIRAKISAASKGKKLTAEHRAKLSVATQGRDMTVAVEAARLANTDRKRAPFTDETIRRMRVAALAREAKKRSVA